MTTQETQPTKQGELDEVALDAIARVLVLIARSIAAGDNAEKNENAYEKSKRK